MVFWTFIQDYKTRLSVFNEALSEKVYEKIFQLSDNVFNDQSHPLRELRLQELKTLDIYRGLLRELGIIFNETLPISVKNNFFIKSGKISFLC